MNVRAIHSALVTGKAVIPFGILACILARIFNNVSWSQWEVWLTLGTQIFISLLWLRFNHRFTVIRRRTVFPSFLYLLFSGANPIFFTSVSACIVSLGIMLCIFSLFSSYQKYYTQDSGFIIALVIGISSLFWPPVLFLFPVFWIGAGWFQAFHWKYFFASIIGLLTVFLFVTAWSVYQGDWNILLNWLPELQELMVFDLLDFSILAWIATGLIIVLMLIAGFNFLLSEYHEKIRVRRYFLFLYAFAIFAFIMTVLQSPEKATWAQIACIPCSVIISHYFALVERKWALLLFFFISIAIIFIHCW